MTSLRCRQEIIARTSSGGKWERMSNLAGLFPIFTGVETASYCTFCKYDKICHDHDYTVELSVHLVG